MPYLDTKFRQDIPNQNFFLLYRDLKLKLGSSDSLSMFYRGKTYKNPFPSGSTNVYEKRSSQQNVEIVNSPGDMIL